MSEDKQPLLISEQLADGTWMNIAFAPDYVGPFLIDKRHYADRDPELLLPEYVQHVEAMTAEGLHAKSAIAAELAFRDRIIARLRYAFFTVVTDRTKEPMDLRRDQEDLLTQHVPNSLAGFYGAFVSEHGRNPNAQEIWNAAIRSYRQRQE